MARNRKSQSAANRFGPALKALLLCLLIGGSGVGYVWQKDQIVRLGQGIKIREQDLARLEDYNEKLRRQLATMRSPRFLEMRIRELNLGLIQPQPTQVWYLPEPNPDLPLVRQKRNSQVDTLLPPPVTPSDEEPIAAGGWQSATR